MTVSEKMPDSRTAHLQPLIDFLKAQGNEPATGDVFYYNRDGYGIYGFAQPLNIEAIRARFDLPVSILLIKDTVQDTRNFVAIPQDFGPQSVRHLSFER